jgi:hypothetical protein
MWEVIGFGIYVSETFGLLRSTRGYGAYGVSFATHSTTYRYSTPTCKGNLTILRRILHLDLAKGNPK